jgi:hypothetical protein
VVLVSHLCRDTGYPEIHILDAFHPVVYKIN